MDDLISRQAAIDRINKQREHLQPDIYPQDKIGDAAYRICVEFIERLPSAQPELSKEDWQLIKRLRRYHNGSYAKVIDKLIASAQQEIIRCKDCKHQEKFFHEDKRRKEGGYYIFGCELASEYSHVCLDDDFCSRAERRADGSD